MTPTVKKDLKVGETTAGRPVVRKREIVVGSPTLDELPLEDPRPWEARAPAPPTIRPAGREGESVSPFPIIPEELKVSERPEGKKRRIKFIRGNYTADLDIPEGDKD